MFVALELALDTRLRVCSLCRSLVQVLTDQFGADQAAAA